MASDKEKGLYQKFTIERTDGSSGPGGKHEHCEYFVLDLDHDQFAWPALAAYEKACRKEFPALANDLRGLIFNKGPRAAGQRRGARGK